MRLRQSDTHMAAFFVLHVMHSSQCMFAVVGKIKQMGNSVRTFCLSGLRSSVPPTALQLDNLVIQATAAAAAAAWPPMGLKGSLLWSLSATASGHHNCHSCSYSHSLIHTCKPLRLCIFGSTGDIIKYTTDHMEDIHVSVWVCVQ